MKHFTLHADGTVTDNATGALIGHVTTGTFGWVGHTTTTRVGQFGTPARAAQNVWERHTKDAQEAPPATD